MDADQTPTAPQKFSTDLQNDIETVTNVSQSTHDFLWKRHPVYSFLTIVLPICAGVLLATYVAYTDVWTRDTLSLMGAIIILSIFISSFSISRVRSRMEALFYTELAPSLGCIYSGSGQVPVSGQLFTFGYDHRLTNELSGTYNNNKFRLADYAYTVGGGKSRQTFNYIIAVLTVGGSIPRVVCRPSWWNHDLSDIWKPSGMERLSLEGDFNSKFMVYVPKGQEIEGLQILEPDVMAKLMDGFDHYGFECIDSHVYLFRPGAMKEDRESVLALLALVKRFCDLLTPELQSFLREPAAT